MISAWGYTAAQATAKPGTCYPSQSICFACSFGTN